MLFFLLACAPAGPDSVLLITIDTLRADHLGSYGYALAQTPNLDRLAQEGVRFADETTTVPITLPAHTSIMTGLLPPAHSVRDNGNYTVPDSLLTWAERLEPLGYTRQAFVSAAVLDSRYNLDQGFEGYDDELWAEDEPPMFMIRDRPATRTTDRFLSWLDTWKGTPEKKPFFAWIHYFDPHQPYEPRYPYSVLSPSPYDAEIAAVDEAIGRVLDGLRQAGVLDNTLVIVTADHGESLGEHGEQTHGFFVYDATIHVPLLMRYPKGKLPAGSVFTGGSSSIDLLPTAFALLGLPMQGSAVQGLDLTAALRGGAAPDRPRYAESLLTQQGFGMAPLFSIRQNGQLWIRAPRPERYDLVNDPKELQNLHPNAPQLGIAMDGQLTEVLQQSEGVGIQAETGAADKETQEMLRALGYLAPGQDQAAMQGMDPKDGLPIYGMLEDARHYIQRHKLNEAESTLRKLLEGAPNHVSALNLLGLTLFQQGRMDDALAIYQKSLSLMAEQPRIYIMLASIKMSANAYDEAQTFLDAALQLSPDFVEAMVQRAILERVRGRDAEAEQWFQKALLAEPDMPRAQQAYADHLFLRQRYAEALGVYKKIIDAKPNYFAMLLQAGLSAQRSADATQARSYFEKAQQIRPDSWIPPYDIACLHAQAGEVDAAFEQLRLVQEKGLNNPAQLQQDPDLNALHGDARWAQLLNKEGKP